MLQRGAAAIAIPICHLTASQSRMTSDDHCLVALKPIACTLVMLAAVVFVTYFSSITREILYRLQFIFAGTHQSTACHFRGGNMHMLEQRKTNETNQGCDGGDHHTSLTMSIVAARV